MSKRILTRKKIEGGLEGFFIGGFASGYFFGISPAFVDQLDISQTSTGATKGAVFSFETGDIFYDAPEAYGANWGDAISLANFAVQISEAVPSSIIQEDDMDTPSKKKKFVLDGALTFMLAKKDESQKLNFEKAEPFKTNQFEFERFLRTGKLFSGETLVFEL